MQSLDNQRKASLKNKVLCDAFQPRPASSGRSSSSGLEVPNGIQICSSTTVNTSHKRNGHGFLVREYVSNPMCTLNGTLVSLRLRVAHITRVVSRLRAQVPTWGAKVYSFGFRRGYYCQASGLHYILLSMSRTSRPYSLSKIL